MLDGKTILNQIGATMFSRGMSAGCRIHNAIHLERSRIIKIIKDGMISGLNWWCIEVKKEHGEFLVFHKEFYENPYIDNIIDFLLKQDFGFDKDTCKFTFYKIGN